MSGKSGIVTKAFVKSLKVTDKGEEIILTGVRITGGQYDKLKGLVKSKKEGQVKVTIEPVQPELFENKNQKEK